MGLALFFSLNGCQIDYYWHLFQGQARIVLNCESIDALLAASDLDPEIENKLIFIEEIREFAGEHIGLENTSSYTCYFDTEGQPISWNLSASPPDRFEPYVWNFPIVGTVPYKGFFDKQLSLLERDELQSRGFDVIVRPVSAYSTLGFLSDPVLSTMLDYPEDSLVDLILHELTHATVYAKGHTDFNESLATFVGQTSSLIFLEQFYGPDTPLLRQARRRRTDVARFRAFMNTVVASLDSLYSLELPGKIVLDERQRVFHEAQEHYRSIRGDFKVVNYDGFLEWKINNARLLSYRRYHRDLERFNKIYALKNQHMESALPVFKSCEDAENPWTCMQDSIDAYSRP